MGFKKKINHVVEVAGLNPNKNHSEKEIKEALACKESSSEVVPVVEKAAPVQKEKSKVAEDTVDLNESLVHEEDFQESQENEEEVSLLEDDPEVSPKKGTRRKKK